MLAKKNVLIILIKIKSLKHIFMQRSWWFGGCLCKTESTRINSNWKYKNHGLMWLHRWAVPPDPLLWYFYLRLYWPQVFRHHGGQCSEVISWPPPQWLTDIWFTSDCKKKSTHMIVFPSALTHSAAFYASKSSSVVSLTQILGWFFLIFRWFSHI